MRLKIANVFVEFTVNIKLEPELVSICCVDHYYILTLESIIN